MKPATDPNEMFMNTAIPSKRANVLLSFFLFALLGTCYGQGTMTFTFEGQPVGTESQIGPYYEGGMRFRAIQPGALNMSGGLLQVIQTTGQAIWKCQMGIWAV